MDKSTPLAIYFIKVFKMMIQDQNLIFSDLVPPRWDVWPLSPPFCEVQNTSIDTTDMAMDGGGGKVSNFKKIHLNDS